jgi:hypothetical protein
VDVILLLLCLVALALIRRRPAPRSGGPIVVFCDDGYEGHLRRVADFYGDDFEEELKRHEARWAYKTESPSPGPSS